MSGVTRYGFRWGPMEVERCAHIKGTRILRITADGHEIHLDAHTGGRWWS